MQNALNVGYETIMYCQDLRLDSNLHYTDENTNIIAHSIKNSEYTVSVEDDKERLVSSRSRHSTQNKLEAILFHELVLISRTRIQLQ